MSVREEVVRVAAVGARRGLERSERVREEVGRVAAVRAKLKKGG